MNDTEFNNQLSTIKMISEQTKPLKEDAEKRNKELNININSLLEQINIRDDNFDKYILLLKEFSFSDNLTSPSDLFPGIRTASDMADPEDLVNKTNQMKDYAAKVDSSSKQIELLLNASINNLKKELNVLIELSKLENQYYDLNMDLLKDMDSVYDVGQLASNT